MMKFFSDSKTVAPNPDPKKYTILAGTHFAGKRSIWMLEVNYAGCTTLDGTKILIYEKEFDAFLEFLRRGELDPHFLDPWDKRLSPIARFPATSEGVDDALRFAEWKSKQDSVS